jgi:hypothetical protein
MKLPKNAIVNKPIPKTQFYNRVTINTKLRDEFIDKIQKIIWKYKIAENTVGINKTENVEEIQVFEIELKEKVIPKNVLKIIDKIIPYPILFVMTFSQDKAYGISLKDKGILENYYFSEWNEEIDFDFNGVNLEKVYQKIIKKFIRNAETEGKDFIEIVEKDNRVKAIEIEIKQLENKLRKERQFNRKVEINAILKQKRAVLDEILNTRNKS